MEKTKSKVMSKEQIFQRAKESLKQVSEEISQLFIKGPPTYDIDLEQRKSLSNETDAQIYDRTAYIIYSHLLKRTGIDPVSWAQYYLKRNLGVRLKLILEIDPRDVGAIMDLLEKMGKSKN